MWIIRKDCTYLSGWMRTSRTEPYFLRNKVLFILWQVELSYLFLNILIKWLLPKGQACPYSMVLNAGVSKLNHTCAQFLHKKNIHMKNGLSAPCINWCNKHLPLKSCTSDTKYLHICCKVVKHLLQKRYTFIAKSYTLWGAKNIHILLN